MMVTMNFFIVDEPEGTNLFEGFVKTILASSLVDNESYLNEEN